MAPHAAFTAIAPRLNVTAASLSSARATCSPTPCCLAGSCRPGCPSFMARRSAFVAGGGQSAFLPTSIVSRASARPSATVRMTGDSVAASGKRVLDDLLAQNVEFAKGNERVHDDIFGTRDVLCTGQSPGAAIVACSDSRTAPEIVFRQGLGEVFTVRVAGNTVTGNQAMGSIQFAVDVLGVQLVMVLGHSKCGAVTAACGGAQLPQAELATLVTDLSAHIDEYGGMSDRVDECAIQNVQAQVAYIEEDLARRGVADPPLVVGAFYDLKSGKVRVVESDVPATVGAGVGA